jgi:hypothetical protein
MIKLAIADLKKVDEIIKSKHRYSCGFEYEGGILLASITDEKARLFFNSPDGQNGELYYALRNLGYHNARYTANYDWKVFKDGAEISYVEGDVYVRTIAKCFRIGCANTPEQKYADIKSTCYGDPVCNAHQYSDSSTQNETD